MKILLAAITVSTFFCFLTGCSHPILPPSHLQASSHLQVSKQKISALREFSVQGKLGLKEGKRGGNIHFHWEQGPTQFKILLFSGLFGSGSVQIQGELTPKGFSKYIRLIREDGTILSAKTPEELVGQELGWHIPISGLIFWLRGIAAPGIPPQRVEYDQENQIWTLEQQGWKVTYQSYQNFGDITVPQKLQLKNGSIELKFIFKSFKK